MTPPINFIFFFRAYFVVLQASLQNNTQTIKGVNVHNNIHTHSDIQTVISTEFLHKMLNLIFKLVRSGNVN